MLSPKSRNMKFLKSQYLIGNSIHNPKMRPVIGQLMEHEHVTVTVMESNCHGIQYRSFKFRLDQRVFRFFSDFCLNDLTRAHTLIKASERSKIVT